MNKSDILFARIFGICIGSISAVGGLLIIVLFCVLVVIPARNATTYSKLVVHLAIASRIYTILYYIMLCYTVFPNK